MGAYRDPCWVETSSTGEITPAARESPVSSEVSSSGASLRDDSFIQHKIIRTDTLAGLAVKYSITVFDIKRANGLLSDSAMFAREYVQIPTRELPIGDDAQVLLARLLSGYGRDASLNARERKAPGTVAAVQLPGSPMISSSRRCSYADDDIGASHSRGSRGSLNQPGDVELVELMMERHAVVVGPDSEGAAADGVAAVCVTAGSYGSDRVRRRTRTSNADDAPSSCLAMPADQTAVGSSHAAGRLTACSGSSAAAPGLTKVKRAPSQPVAAGGIPCAKALHTKASVGRKCAGDLAIAAVNAVNDLAVLQRCSFNRPPSFTSSQQAGEVAGWGSGIDLPSRGGLAPVAVRRASVKSD